MNLELILPVVNSILFFGIFYGMTNSRLKNLESRIADQNDQAERLTRVEEKINLLINHFIK